MKALRPKVTVTYWSPLMRMRRPFEVQIESSEGDQVGIARFATRKEAEEFRAELAALLRSKRKSIKGRSVRSRTEVQQSYERERESCGVPDVGGTA